MDQRKTSSRPYTVGSFKRKLELFERFIGEFTHVDEELNPEERRLQLQERLTNGEGDTRRVAVSGVHLF